MSASLPFCLRAATYLSPSIPVEYFENLLQYLEKKLGIHTSLYYESRWEGPPPDRKDPFINNDIDIAWISSTVYLRMMESGNPSIELLPISSVHYHPKAEDRPGYFADVVIHKDLCKSVKEFEQLRGCTWAYNSEESLSGHVITLQTLRELGENASFFGNILASGSHLDSIRMVLEKKAEAAAIDANCLSAFLKRNPHFKKELSVITSWGMLSPYPIVVNTRLPDEIKKNIQEALLSMHLDPEGSKVLTKFGVRRFTPTSDSDYETEKELINFTKNLKFTPVYY